jgi:type I restriction enzyme S subunit
MELKPGYKQTDLGIFPEEWAVEPLGGHATFRTGPFGSALHKSDYTSDGIPIVNPMHIVNGKVEPTRTMTVTEEAARKLSDFRLKAGEIVIGRRGDMGRCAVVREQYAGWLCGTGSMIIRPRGVDPAFLQRVLSSPRSVAAIEHASVGTTMVNLNQATLSELAIQFPPLPEQRAIGAALSEVNALLDGLDRLIAKKRDLKQAALQQLLTGSKRLPGFKGHWEVKRLGDGVTFLRHGVNPRAELVSEGQVKYLHYGEVHASRNVYLSPDALPCLPVSKAAGLDRLQDGDLVFADASEDVEGVCKSVEIRGVGDTDLVAGLHTIAARFDQDLLADGFKGFLQFCPEFSTHLRRLAAGTKVYATNRAHIASVEMRVPSVAEQTAIATVLADMDSEIAALEARRHKTYDLKAAMSQELLTGKTRLVHAQVANA